MELKEGTTNPAYTQPRLVMKDGVKSNSGTGASIQLSVMFSTSTCKACNHRQIDAGGRPNKCESTQNQSLKYPAVASEN